MIACAIKSYFLNLYLISNPHFKIGVYYFTLRVLLLVPPKAGFRSTIFTCCLPKEGSYLLPFSNNSIVYVLYFYYPFQMGDLKHYSLNQIFLKVSKAPSICSLSALPFNIVSKLILLKTSLLLFFSLKLQVMNSPESYSHHLLSGYCHLYGYQH